jgi:hypothetical protein
MRTSASLLSLPDREVAAVRRLRSGVLGGGGGGGGEIRLAPTVEAAAAPRLANVATNGY